MRPKPSENTVSFENVTVLYETEKALLVDIDGDETWIPKSVIHDDSEVYKMETEGQLVLPQWFAEKEKLA